MGKDSSPPPAPDPSKTASTQAQYDQNTANYNAQLNRYNVNTPFGSQTWTQGDPTRTFNQQKYDDAYNTARNNAPGVQMLMGADGQYHASGGDFAAPDKNADQFYDVTPSTHWSQQITLTPDAQQALTNTMKTQAGLSGLQGQALGGVAQTLASNPFDKSQLPARPINAGQTAQDALMSRLTPQVDLENKQFEADMANRGLAQGSEPYLAAKRSLSNTQVDRQMQAAATGISVGNDSRNQAIQEQGYYANAPLNYLNGLMSGSQVQTPQFQSTPNVMSNAPNYQQAVTNQYQGQLNAYNAQTGSDNSTQQGLMQAAMLAAMFLSDRRLKSNVVRVGTHPYGIGIYEYDIGGHRQRGVMADEVERVKPEAVVMGPDGLKRVNYGML